MNEDYFCKQKQLQKIPQLLSIYVKLSLETFLFNRFNHFRFIAAKIKINAQEYRCQWKIKAEIKPWKCLANTPPENVLVFDLSVTLNDGV
jgi:hypothetical protein